MPNHKGIHRVGDYLVIDEVTGIEYWRSDCAFDWDGTLRQASDVDGKHPDYMPRHYPKETFPDYTSVPAPVTAYSNVKVSAVGGTSIEMHPWAVDPLLD